MLKPIIEIFKILLQEAEQKMGQSIIPNRIWFSLTGLCNNKCRWCYRSGSEIKSYLDKSYIMQIANTMANSGLTKCTIIGGEPTLHPEHESIVSSLTKEYNFSCAFVTNGRIFSSGIPTTWHKNPKIHVIISLHGADSLHYYQNTGSPDGFEQTVTAIKHLVANNIAHSVNVVINKENLQRIPEFIGVLAHLKVNILCFTIGISSVDDPSYQTIPYQIASSIAAIHKLCNTYNQKHMFIFSLPWCLLEQRLLEELIEEKELLFNCPVDQGKGIVIKENGAVTICTHLSNYEILSHKNALPILSNKEKFITFWNSQKLNKLREVANVYRTESCLTCQYRLYCKGGCPLWWQNYDFKIDCLGIQKEKGGDIYGRS